MTPPATAAGQRTRARPAASRFAASPATAVRPAATRAATAAPPRRAPRARTATRPPAPRVARRISGPLRAPVPQTAGAPAVHRGHPLGERVVAGLRALPDHPWLDRLVRGRAWIMLIGFGLIGLVAMQVSMLGMNAQIGRSLQRAAVLDRENATLRATVSSLSAGDRVEAAATSMGYVAPDAGSIRFLATAPAADATRAARALRPPLATAGTAGSSAAGSTASSSAGTASAASSTSPADTSAATAAPGPASASAASGSGASAGTGTGAASPTGAGG